MSGYDREYPAGNLKPDVQIQERHAVDTFRIIVERRARIL